ncbi:MAG TPA: ATP citrate lyase citrate-binding domain-containing protein, partial [Candidatus Nitrosocosmicus sp.]|nr:ATP citrate lyase citrate-binding domain-containing protein [Candidatus Nitrosocosmicus sp.]
MARKKLSEYKAKQIVLPSLELPFEGKYIDVSQSPQILDGLSSGKTYVIKVDQGIKGRMKKGLVIVNVISDEVITEISKLKAQGYEHLFIEEFIPHADDQESFISLEREREGIKVYYSNKGGIHVENNTTDIKSEYISPSVISDIADHLHVPSSFIDNLITTFEANYFSFLEINPLVVIQNKIYILDLAVEVDSAGEFFVQNSWSRNDYVQEKRKTLEEQEVENLAKTSQTQASFTLNVLNPNGSIFLLLSGGGASLVLADELYNLGYGKEIANYGEYSGNPSSQETYLYTKNLLKILIKSTAIKKTLIIG